MPTIKLYYDGWLTLPAGIRQKLDLATGDQLLVEITDGKIVLRSAIAARARPPAEARATVEPAAQQNPLPLRREPGQPRKAEAASAAAAPVVSGPKKPRGRPRKAPVPVPTPEPAASVTSEPWRLLKKAELETPAVEAPGQPSASWGPRPRHDSSASLVERRPFRNVEVRKLGPGRGHVGRELQARRQSGA